MNFLQQMTPLLLYCLKRDYGGAIDLYQLTSSVTDVKTGVRTVEVTKYHIHRAIIMPVRMARAQLMLRTSLHNKAFYNLHDEGSREFIIERKDARGLTTITPDDYIVYEHQKYQIGSVEDYETGGGWVITTKVDPGGAAQEVQDAKVSDTLTLSETSNGTF